MNTVAPTQHAVYVAMKAFIVSVIGLDPALVIQGLPNRAAMPLASPGFVTMQIPRTRRLRTNQDTRDLTDVAPTAIAVEMGTELRMQLDLYGAAAGDWAVILQALLRDETGCIALAPACQPLYTGDAFLAPLDDSESQYEQRWTLEAVLQYNPVTSVPMQFADTASVTLINVDEAYPP